jgi:hypothetical protein
LTTIKAIETHYAGCRFRSRLEARWAVFLNHLDIEWDYEPEGFQFDGERYLPDFFLHEKKIFLEVKGAHTKAADDLDRYLRFAANLPYPHEIGDDGGIMGPAPLYVVGNIPQKINALGAIRCLAPFGRALPKWLPPGQDAHLLFGLDESNPDLCVEAPAGHVIWQWANVFWRPASHDDVVAAAAAARSARFEHGESG